MINKSSKFLIVDYGNWLSSDIFHFLNANSLHVKYSINIQYNFLFRLIRLFFTIFGRRNHFHDFRRLLEFFLLDILSIFQIIFYRPNTFFFLKDQILLSVFLAKILRIKTVCIFGNRHIRYDYHIKSSFRKIYIGLEDLQISLSDLIICESSFVKKSIKHKNVLVIHSFEFFSCINSVEKLRSNNDVKNILFVDGDARKGREFVIPIIPHLPNNFKMTVINGVGYDKFKDLIHLPLMSKPLFLNLLDSFDLVIIPTWSDGGPRLFFESLARSIPVIISSNSACPDLFSIPIVFPVPLSSNSLLRSIRELPPIAINTKIFSKKSLVDIIRTQQLNFLNSIQ